MTGPDHQSSADWLAEAQRLLPGGLLGRAGLPIGAVTGPAETIDLADWDRKSTTGHVLVNGTHHGLTLAAFDAELIRAGGSPPPPTATRSWKTR